jgi:DNA modification methylase
MSGLRVAGPADGAGGQVIGGVRMPTEIVLLEVAALLPFARNSRTHSPAQIEALARHMLRVGWTNPVLVADGTILAGHGRVLAAEKLGLARVPCIDLSHLDETTRRELVIWDNRSGEAGMGSTWDLDMLKAETDELRALGVDLEANTGWSEEDLAALFEGMDDAEGGDGDPDDAPALPDEPVSRVGDVWVMGPHRLAVGDTTDPVVWDRLLRGEVVDVAWTDPPYLVDVGRKNRLMDAAVGGNRSKSGEVANDKGMTEGDFGEFLARAFANLFAALKPGASIYVAHSDKAGGIFRREFEAVGFHFSQGLVWNKTGIVLGVADHQPSHEPIMYGWKPGSRHRWYGGRKQRTVIEAGAGEHIQQLDDGRWVIRAGDQVLVVSGEARLEEAPTSVLSVPKPAKSGLHPTQKPVELVERQLRNSARPGDIVADAFGGSGSTLVAADRLGMSARLVELDEGFADVIVRRWEALTGRRAVHAITGEEFPREGEARSEAVPEPEAEDDGMPF